MEEKKENRMRSVNLYKRELRVGQGTFANVYKARIKAQYSLSGHDEVVALKQLNLKSEKEGFPITALREIMLLSKLRHPNIMHLVEMVASKKNTYMVFEYMDYDLLGIIDKKVSLEPAHIKCILYQLLQGMQFLHSHNIVHRDIKTANILVSSRGEIKIGDFGLARLMDKKNKNYTNGVVTLWYRSPELLLGSTDYTVAIDMWSVGCCFAELLNLSPLFKVENESKLIEMIYQKCGSPTEDTWPEAVSLPYFSQFQPRQYYPRRLAGEFKSNKKVDMQAIYLIEKMLVLNPQKRITAEEALRHPYFSTEPLACPPEKLPLPATEAHDYQIKHHIPSSKIAENRQPQGSHKQYINRNYYSSSTDREYFDSLPFDGKRPISKDYQRESLPLEPKLYHKQDKSNIDIY